MKTKLLMFAIVACSAAILAVWVFAQPASDPLAEGSA